MSALELLSLLLIIAVFVGVPLLAMMSAFELYRLARFMRQQHPELYHGFSGYGAYPTSTRENLLRFALARERHEQVGGELAQHCKRVKSLIWTTGGTLAGGVCMLMLLFDR